VRAESSEEKTVVNVPAAKPVTKPSPPKTAFQDDELTFVDGFLDGERASSKKQTGAVAAGTPIAAEIVEAMADKEIDEDLAVSSFITPPKISSATKSSKLDTYHVEIRRPGKRT
jgi:two-component system NtrC family sensor kinase